MQSDIVQRLKEASQGMRSHYKVGAVELIPTSTMDEAAAEIARLRKIVSAFNNGMPPMTTKDAAAEIARLTEALRAIDNAVIEGRVCDDVAWFSPIETLHDFIQEVLHPSPPAALADLFPTALKENPHADA